MKRRSFANKDIDSGETWELEKALFRVWWSMVHLADALMIFKWHRWNLMSINSHPRGMRPWQYIFFVEYQKILEVHGDDMVGEVSKELQAVTETGEIWEVGKI